MRGWESDVQSERYQQRTCDPSRGGMMHRVFPRVGKCYGTRCVWRSHVWEKRRCHAAAMASMGTCRITAHRVPSEGGDVVIG